MTTTGPSRPQGWVPELHDFGARLALLRRAMGWNNIAEAAKACAIPVASWRNWESRGHEPRGVLNIALKIAGVTGVDYRWLADHRWTVRGPVDERTSSVNDSSGVTLRYAGLGERVVAVGMAERPTVTPRDRFQTRTRPISRARPDTMHSV